MHVSVNLHANTHKSHPHVTRVLKTFCLYTHSIYLLANT